MPLVIVPARLKSARLPDKPLQIVGSDPLIVHCWRRAMEADIGPVHVAADSEAIIEVITRAGGQAVLTGSAHCGTDRTALAAEIVDPEGAHQRINFVQVFSRVGYAVTPLVATALIYNRLIRQCLEFI